MRIFETFRPKNNIIKKYVQYYYLEIDEHNSEREFTCFPHYNTAISIYKSHKRYKDATVEFKPDLLPLQIFTPIRKDILTVKQLGKIYRIVIIFNPLGIQNFFDNLNFTDYFTDFSFFKKDEINQLFTTTDIETLRNLLDSFLIKRICNNSYTFIFYIFQKTLIGSACTYEYYISVLYIITGKFSNFFFF